jgi:hypothetical protein
MSDMFQKTSLPHQRTLPLPYCVPAGPCGSTPLPELPARPALTQMATIPFFCKHQHILSNPEILIAGNSRLMKPSSSTYRLLSSPPPSSPSPLSCSHSQHLASSALSYFVSSCGFHCCLSLLDRSLVPSSGHVQDILLIFPGKTLISLCGCSSCH